jgi:ubiquitin-protein ligase
MCQGFKYVLCSTVHIEIVGSDGTPYTGGIFMLDITIPDR